MSENKSIATKILSIIYLIIYFLYTAFLIATFVSSLGGSNVQLSLAIFLVYFVLTFGSICYGALVILAIAGLIVSCVKKIKRSSKLFGFFIALPIITEVLFIALTYLTLNWLKPLFSGFFIAKIKVAIAF